MEMILPVLRWRAVSLTSGDGSTDDRMLWDEPTTQTTKSVRIRNSMMRIPVLVKLFTMQTLTNYPEQQFQLYNSAAMMLLP
jgi:hypothetical protein